MTTELFPNHAYARRFYLGLGLLSVLAWSLLGFWQRSAYSELLGHESLGDHHLPFAWRLAAFLLSWFFMTVAMMLPGSLPMLIHSAQPAWQRAPSARSVGLVLVGYLSLWLLFGLLAFLGDSLLHELTEPTAPLAGFSYWIAPLIVLTAGLFQLTPLKRHSMERCRPAQAQMLQGEAQRTARAGALQQGLRLGGACMGSCWALMLLMFALGHHRLDGMIALSVIFAAERLAPWGHRLAWLVGLGLVVWAVFWLFATAQLPVSPLAPHG